MLEKRRPKDSTITSTKKPTWKRSLSLKNIGSTSIAWISITNAFMSLLIIRLLLRVLTNSIHLDTATNVQFACSVKVHAFLAIKQAVSQLFMPNVQQGANLFPKLCIENSYTPMHSVQVIAHSTHLSPEICR